MSNNLYTANAQWASRPAKQAARTAASANGHKLGRWAIEAGRPVAVCACGGYAAIERSGGELVYATGRLPISGARNILNPCTREA